MQQQTVKKDDLNALIAKIYTEQQNEDDSASSSNTDGGLKDSGKMSSSFDESNSLTNTNHKNPSQKQQPKSSAIVMTKTSPLVAAALGYDDFNDDDFSLMLSETSTSKDKQHNRPAPSLIDNSIKHQIIKQVSDSMDNLKHELLNKGMDKYADDVDCMGRQLESAAANSKKKTDEMERIRREQDLIKKEKEIIEHEKEKLRQEAEQLRLERELILMTTTVSKSPQAGVAVNNSISGSNTNIQSSSTSSTSSTIDQLDAGYGTMNEQPGLGTFTN